MLDEKLFNQISARWKGRIYQEWSKEKHRLLHFEKVAPVFHGKHVIDMGCNAGLHAIEVCRYAQSYLGIEKDELYYQQALKTRLFMYPSTCEFVQANAIDYVLDYKPDCDALLLSFVIYHFTDDEIVQLRDRILPAVPLVVVYNRVDRPTIKNSYDLHEHDKMVRFLESVGFTTEFEWGRKELFYSIVARREEAHP